MHLSKRQLKTIIREEKIKLLKEDAMPNTKMGMQLVKAVTDSVMNYLTREVLRPEELDGHESRIKEDIRDILYKVVATHTNDLGLEEYRYTR
jgi:hypothetical protein